MLGRAATEVPLRVFFILIVLSVMLLLIPGALARGPTEVSANYRYAGVVVNGRGAATHYIGTGDGIALHFFDALSQGRKSERYRVCVGRPRHAPTRCWGRTAAYGLGKVQFPHVLPADVPVGILTARWFAAGHLVATWPFFYAR